MSYRVSSHDAHGPVCCVLCRAVLSAVLQLLMGLVRPAASAPTMRRHMWDVGHTLLGRTGMMLGVLNAILGIFIFTTAYGGEAGNWKGPCMKGCLTACHRHYGKLLPATVTRPVP